MKTFLKTFLIFILLISLHHANLFAQKYWDGGPTGTGTNWSDDANWQPDGVPTNTDDVILDFTYVPTSYTVNMDQPSGVSKNFTIDADGSGTITLELSDDFVTAFNGDFVLTSGPSGNAVVDAASYTITCGGNWDVGGDETFNAGTGLVRLLNGSSTTINAPTMSFHNLEIPAGVKTLISNIKVVGDLQIGTPSTLDVNNAGNYSIFIEGDFINNGTFESRAGTVEFEGGNNHQIAGSGTTTFYNVTVNKSSNTLNLGANLNCSNEFKIESGDVDTRNRDANFEKVLIQSGGILKDTQTAGNNIFNGTLTIEAGGEFDLLQSNNNSFYDDITHAGNTFQIGINANSYFSSSLNITADADMNIGGNIFITGSNILTIVDAVGEVRLTSLGRTLSITISTGQLINQSQTGLEIVGNLTGSGTFKNDVNAVLKYGGPNIPMPAGTFDVGTNGNKVIYNSQAPTQSVKAETYYHLDLVNDNPSSAVIKELTSGDITVNGDLKVSSSQGQVVTFQVDETITVAENTSVENHAILTGNLTGNSVFQGNLEVQTGGTFNPTVNGADKIIFQGGISNSGAFNLQGTGTCEFTTNTQNISASAATIFDIVTDIQTNVAAQGAEIVFGDDLRVSASSTFTNQNTNGVTIEGELLGLGTFEQDGGAILILEGTSNTIATLDATATNNQVIYAGGNNQSIITTTYKQLIIDKSTVSVAAILAGDITVNDILIIRGNGNLNLSSYAVTLGDDFQINSTSAQFTPGTGKVIFGGTGTDQTFSSDLSSTNFNNIDINNSNNVTFSDNVVMTGTSPILNLLDGHLVLNANLTVSAIATINASASSYIETASGSFIINNLPSGTGRTFHIGTSDVYAPLNINPSVFTNWEVSVSSGVTAKPASVNNYTNLSWDISPTVANTASISFNWNGGVSGTLPASSSLFRYLSPSATWVPVPASTIVYGAGNVGTDGLVMSAGSNIFSVFDYNILNVTNTQDAGVGSLRQAILISNLLGGNRTINFNVPTSDLGYDIGTGVWTINPSTALPSITQPLIIDAFSQPGATVNTTNTGSNADIKIVLDGSTLGSGGIGFNISSNNAGIKGFSIINFDNSGITLTGGIGSSITGNFIGVRPDGTSAAGNGTGISITSGSSGNSIGSANLADRNLISGNTDFGISVNASNNNQIKGNAIGINKDENNLGNAGSGILIYSGANSNFVGGTIAGEGNIIAYNNTTMSVTNAGVYIDEAGTIQNRVLGNSIFCNQVSGITLSNNGNGNKPAPTITEATTTRITGTAAANDIIEIFDNQSSGCTAQGLNKIGEVTANASGDWVYTNNPPLGAEITVTSTSTTNGTSPFSSIATTILAPPNPPVANPATAITETSFTASWQNTANVDAYFIDISTNADFATGSFITENLDVGTNLTYDVTGLTRANIYYYRVRANNAAGISGNSNIITVSTSKGVPSMPASVGISGDITNGVTLTWEKTSDNTESFIIERMDVNNVLTEFNQVAEVTADNLSYEDSLNLFVGITYFYRVRAANTEAQSDFTEPLGIAFAGGVTTGLEDIENLGIKLYPNPVETNLFVQNTAQVLIDKVIIRNMKGEILEQIKISDSEVLFDIDLQKYTSGMYLIEIETSQKSLQFKVVKQ